MDTRVGVIRVQPVLFCAPVFWTPDFWSPATHRWDWVTPETPLDEKPSAEFEISLDVTLEELFEAACDAWGIEAGPGLLTHGGTRAQQFVRFGFVHADRDARGVSPHEGYGWPAVLPVPRIDGTVEQCAARNVTYRELLAASLLGLIDGDVSRPYVHPVISQGDAGTVIEVGVHTAEAIRAAYSAIDDSVGFAIHTLRLIRASLPGMHHITDTGIDEGVRIAAAVTFIRWLRRKFRRKRRPHA